MTPREMATAMRKGAALRPQARVMGPHETEWNDGTCALGALYEGASGEYLGICGDPNWLLRNGVSEDLMHEIWTKNDYECMTREQIADWLDTLDVSKPKDAQTFAEFMAVTMVPVPMDSSTTPKEMQT
jgi:hypothetical protein